MAGIYELIFEGVNSEDANELRSVKGILLSDLGLSIEQIKDIFDRAPISLLTAESREELEVFYGKLTLAGASVVIKDHTEEANQTEEIFEFEIELEEQDYQNEKVLTPEDTPVYDLDEADQGVDAATLDLETFDKVSELLGQLSESSQVAKHTSKIVEKEPDYSLAPLAEESQILEEKNILSEPIVEPKLRKHPKAVEFTLPNIKSIKPQKQVQSISPATLLAIAAAFLVIVLTAIPVLKIQTFDEPAKELADKIAAEFIDLNTQFKTSQELFGQVNTEGYFFTARMYQGIENLYSLRVTVAGQKPKEPTELEKLRGIKLNPGLDRLSVETDNIKVLPDGSFESLLNGVALINYGGTSYQIPIQGNINGKIVNGGTASVIWVRFIHGLNELDVADENLIRAIEDGEFQLFIASEINLDAN
ncbi:MAG: hypothetical protein R3A13_02340 [Bdellovibrionota bacterium]